MKCSSGAAVSFALADAISNVGFCGSSVAGAADEARADIESATGDIWLRSPASSIFDETAGEKRRDESDTVAGNHGR